MRGREDASVPFPPTQTPVSLITPSSSHPDGLPALVPQQVHGGARRQCSWRRQRGGMQGRRGGGRGSEVGGDGQQPAQQPRSEPEGLGRRGGAMGEQ